MSSEALETQQKVILDQTQYFRANHVVRISIQAHFPRMFNKVGRWPILNAKMLNTVLTHTKILDILANHAPSLL